MTTEPRVPLPMARPPSDPAVDPVEVANRATAPSTRRRPSVAGVLFWLLLGAYALGLALPGPGLALREWQWRPLGAESVAPVRFSLAMVAVILFCGAVGASGGTRDFFRRPGAIATALAGVWLPPLLLAATWSVVVARSGLANGWGDVGLGLALVAAMPVANSAVGWTQQSRGSLPWALGLVVLSIAVTPWLAPLSLAALGAGLSPADPDAARAVVERFTGWVFVAWVLAPTACGLVVRWLLGRQRAASLRTPLVVASAGCIVLLNYANASAALPRIVDQGAWGQALAALAAATLLPVVGAVCGWRLAAAMALPRHACVAWSYALGMKNTGLALGLLDAAAGDYPGAVLVILLSTLTQHAVAAATHGLTTRAAGDAE
ncbi:MAG: bile acid:sodium symporter [Lacipirellulaceae bacterium]